MKVYGNLNHVKKAIETKYKALSKEIDEEIRQRIAEYEQQHTEKLETLREQNKANLEKEKKELFSKILNDEKLKAKREYEEFREELINRVFEEVMKKAPNFVHTADYIKLVEKKLKNAKKLEAVGDSTFYKKKFPKLKLDKSITGLRFREGTTVYDFTVGAELASRQEALRSIINQKLFGEK